MSVDYYAYPIWLWGGLEDKQFFDGWVVLDAIKKVVKVKMTKLSLNEDKIQKCVLVKYDDISGYDEASLGKYCLFSSCRWAKTKKEAEFKLKQLVEGKL